MRFIRLGAVTALCTFGLASPCWADFVGLGPALQFAVLGQFSNAQTNFNNGTIVGDVGIGSPRAFTISNADLTGNVRFSGAANTSGFLGGPCSPSNVSGGGCFTGSIIANDPVVTAALNSANAYGQFLGGEAGLAINIASGGSINASSGVLHPDGNRVFTQVGSVNFPNGAFTINGSASDFVVINISTSANLHGQILLAGGITSDHVIVNMFGGDYALHTGGPTLDVNTNGLATFAIFLDPNGSMSAVNTDIHGRFFGGDNSNQQIVSGFHITAPTTTTPEPSTIVLMATGLFGVSGIGFIRRRRA